MSGQFWSDIFNWMDTEVDIAHGIVDLHVTFNGEEVVDAPVYLFTASGSYLGRYEYTDLYGHAAFLVPAQSYKFRVDYDGTQYWSDVISVIAHEETDVEMPLEQLALNVTNDPKPVRFDGKPPIFEPERIKVASIGTLIGILSQTVVANTTPPKVYYYLNDHLGTPQLMTDENNVVVWEAKYRPFGEAVVHPYSTVENNIRFPGQYFDQETGLHYNYHRYYDPRTGRYLRADPIGLVGGINLFLYAENNPINFTDSLGLAIWVCNRKTRWNVGNHAYLWDDRNRTCCGMGSIKECKEGGPANDSCNKVAGSHGKEAQIMKCCRDTADKGIWFPLINDCHEGIDDCIKAAGLKNPGAPGGRLGKPCDPCEEKK